MLLEMLFAVVLGAIIYLLWIKRKEELLPIGDGWWGKGQKPDAEEDETIYPFKVEVSEDDINYLHRRLDEARYPESLEKSYFHYGFNSTYLKKVMSYWRNQFNWKKQVEILNKYPQFKTKIEGIDVHFLHLKPSHLPEGQSAKPLLMIHGWPSSFYELYKIIPLLMDPASHFLKGGHVFEIIIPSVPGFGFSEAPHKKGFNTASAARVFYKLMLRLGFHEYYVQGGDWGGLIGTNLAQMAPSHVKGLHIHFLTVDPMGYRVYLSTLLGKYFPRLFGFQSKDIERIYPVISKMMYMLALETGYFHLQITAPDTAGYGLNDSPVGLAAYILEKFAIWTDLNFRRLEDGGLEKKFSLDDLLTNVMIYWVSGCIVPSMRLYKETIGRIWLWKKQEEYLVRVPTAIASFPNEVVHIPRYWAEQKYVNLVSFNYQPRGGHFAVFEEPELIAADFVQLVEKVGKDKMKKK